MEKATAQEAQYRLHADEVALQEDGERLAAIYYELASTWEHVGTFWHSTCLQLKRRQSQNAERQAVDCHIPRTDPFRQRRRLRQ